MKKNHLLEVVAEMLRLDNKDPKPVAVMRVTTLLLTLTARNCIIPHHVAILENARDGLRAVCLNKALLAEE